MNAQQLSLSTYAALDRGSNSLVAGFVPPIVVSGLMMIWPPNVNNLKKSPLGKYISK